MPNRWMFDERAEDISPSKDFSARAHIQSMAEYEKLYKRSVEDPEGFWAEMADKNLIWFKKWDKVLDYDFKQPYIKWFPAAS